MNNAACFRYLSAFDARDHVPINVPGLYCISAVYKNSHHADPELLQSLLENSLKFKAQKKHLFCGDKERLIDKIFQEGLIKSSLFKNFIIVDAVTELALFLFLRVKLVQHFQYQVHQIPTFLSYFVNLPFLQLLVEVLFIQVHFWE